MCRTGRNLALGSALGGSGNDTIASGGGIDVVSGDEGDDQVNVRDNTADLVSIRGGTVQVRKGRALIKVSCPAISPANCTGSLAVRTAKGVKLAGLRVVLQLGSARYNLAPGVSKTLKVKLAKGGKRLAGRNGHLKVLAVASTGPSGKIAQSSQRLTLALGKATKGK